MAVTINDVAVLLGRTAPPADSPEGNQWAAWIAQAQNLITWRYGTERVAEFDPELVEYVVSEAVAQHIRDWRPQSIQRKSVSVDDGTVDTSWFKSAGSLTIADALWAHLDPARASGAFSVQMTGEPDRHPFGVVGYSTWPDWGWP